MPPTWGSASARSASWRPCSPSGWCARSTAGSACSTEPSGPTGAPLAHLLDIAIERLLLVRRQDGAEIVPLALEQGADLVAGRGVRRRARREGRPLASVAPLDRVDFRLLRRCECDALEEQLHAAGPAAHRRLGLGGGGGERQQGAQ